tara:strand:+ start:10984 stop:11502 length:519 start_codon:yes stop_codon:yes gene_type:complete
MKKLITLILILFTITSYGQTKLDKEIFKVVNEYRVSNGLTEWEWNKKLFKVAEKHNYYQTQINSISHEEQSDVKSHVEVNSLGGRAEEGDINNWRKVGENLAVTPSENLSISEIAEKVLIMWINSPPHHELLLCPDYHYQYVAVSSHITTDYVKAVNCKKWTYVTLNVLATF